MTHDDFSHDRQESQILHSCPSNIVCDQQIDSFHLWSLKQPRKRLSSHSCTTGCYQCQLIYWYWTLSDLYLLTLQVLLDLWFGKAIVNGLLGPGGLQTTRPWWVSPIVMDCSSHNIDALYVEKGSCLRLTRFSNKTLEDSDDLVIRCAQRLICIEKLLSMGTASLTLLVVCALHFC